VPGILFVAMISALVLAAATATASPSAGTGVQGNSNPKAANSGAMRTFSGGNVQPIRGTSEPLLQKAAPQPNTHVTAGPLLKKAAPGASPNPAGRHALREFSGATTPTDEAPGIRGDNGSRWGWAGIFGVVGLMGLWRRFSGE
jgi:hypothetical protein